MKLTLRKSNALQNSIQEALRSVKVETSTTISEFENLEQKIERSNTELLTADAKRSDLLKVQYMIRGLVGSANAVSGIDAKLTQAAYIDKRIGQLTELASSKKVTDIAILNGKLEKLRNRKEESSRIYGFENELSTGVLNQDQIDQISDMIKDLKKQKQKLNDEILELNVRTEIELDDDAVKILQGEKLV
jgi:hypothetical protein